MGEVVDAGAGRVLDKGELHQLAVSVDDRVLFGKYAGTDVRRDDVENLVM